MISIFLVDDEPEIMELYCTILEPEGFRVIAQAANGIEAMKKYEELSSKPDLIILDERMPFMSGIETAREILGRDREARILFVSADPMVKIYARTLGVLGFLEKPFEKNKFVDTIKNVFEPLRIARGETHKPQRRDGGESYLFEDEGEAFSFFSSKLSLGAAGLCITRQFPDNLKSKHGIAGIPFIWLSQIEKMENTIDPSNLSKLVLTITSFMEENPGCAVLLEGLEYLTIQNSFERMMKHLHQINDSVMAGRTTFIVVANLDSFEETHKAILKTEWKLFKA